VNRTEWLWYLQSPDGASLRHRLGYDRPLTGRKRGEIASLDRRHTCGLTCGCCGEPCDLRWQVGNGSNFHHTPGGHLF
jgi:hypothetical protein